MVIVVYSLKNAITMISSLKASLVTQTSCTDDIFLGLGGRIEVKGAVIGKVWVEVRDKGLFNRS